MQPSSPENREALMRVVRAQTQAFAAGDFAEARSFAAAGLQRQFTTETFRIMITRGYPALLSGRELHFGRASDNGIEGFLDVRVTDQEGVPRWFRYALVREPAGWRIAGVVPLELPVASLEGLGVRSPGSGSRTHAVRLPKSPILYPESRIPLSRNGSFASQPWLVFCSEFRVYAV